MAEVYYCSDPTIVALGAKNWQEGLFLERAEPFIAYEHPSEAPGIIVEREGEFFGLLI
jgi:hypothetical protein